MISRRMIVIAGAAAALCGAVAAPALAQEYPVKPIRLIVPFPPGGGTDILARVVGQKMSETLGQPVIVENKPGAGGNIGVDLAAKAQPDGHTIVIGQTANLAVNPTLYPKLPYNPLKDLEPVGLIASAPLAIVVPAASPFKTLADPIALAKTKPGDITFASPGNGTVAHLSGELIQKAAGIRFEHIPYKGAAQALTDLLGGQVHLYSSSVPTALGHIRSGKLRAIAVTSTRRVPDLPDTPTVAELGFPGFEASTWFGLLAPAGTPRPVIAKLHLHLMKALDSTSVQEKIKAEGAGKLTSTPDEFRAFLVGEVEKWGKIVRDSGARID